MSSPYRTSLMSFLILAILGISWALDMSIVGSTRSDSEVLALYEAWLVEHGKVYNGIGEKERRFEIFKDNLRFINDHNTDRNYKLGLNKFADLTNDEYRSKFLGSTKAGNTEKKISSRYAQRLGDDLPESVDWREKGAVAHVKNQGSCQSSWAFSTTAVVEGINQIVTGNLITLSNQQLVDCDTQCNDGCNGGQVDLALEFIVINGGVNSEEDYPYTESQQKCGKVSIFVTKKRS